MTGGSWQNYWLNEGFTVFEERRVSAELYGYNFALTEAMIGDHAIKEAVRNYGAGAAYTKLNPGPYKGDNPDNAEGEIPYEKGFQFLWHIQLIVGKETFQGFLRHYFLQNREKSVWDFQMLQQLKAYLVETQGE